MLDQFFHRKRGKKKAPETGLLHTTVIDTVVIELNNLILPENLELFHPANRNGVFSLEYPRRGQKNRVYTPVFTIYGSHSKLGSGWVVNRLLIQASAPKLLHGTSYFGVTRTDYEEFVTKMVEVSNKIGLPLTRSQIENASLKSFALTINFYLPNDFPFPLEYLRKMSFLDIGKRYKNIKGTNYLDETEGYSGKLYNGQVGFGLYDKRSQLINKAETDEEKEIVEKMAKGLLPDKVLRFEVTFQNQEAVRQYLSTRIGGRKDQIRNVREIFNDSFVKGILEEVFARLVDEINLIPLDLPLMSPEEAYKIARSSGLSGFDAEALIGRSYIIQQIGSLEYKNLQDRQLERYKRSRLEKRHRQILGKITLPKFALGQIIEVCRKQLSAFQILKPSNVEILQPDFEVEDAFSKFRRELTRRGVIKGTPDRTVTQSKV